MDITLSPMTKDMISQVAQIEKLCFSSPWSEQSLEEELNNSNAVLTVALHDDKVIGYAGLLHIIDEGHVLNVAVMPQYRKKGIGKMLVQNFINYAENNELYLLTLEVRESNSPAIKLYSSFGFKPLGKRKNYYTNPCENAIIMTRYTCEGGEIIDNTIY